MVRGAFSAIMVRDFFIILIKVGALLFFLAACSLYESSGRQAIEKNEGGIVTSGLILEPQGYYVCSRAYILPDFLKEPLEVLATPYEKRNYSVLLKTNSAPDWLVIYKHNTATEGKNENADEGAIESYDSCKIFFLKPNPPAIDLLRSADLGAEQLMRFKIERR